VVWAPDYVTATQLKSYLNIQHDDDDLWLANWATAVSRNVDDFCGRQFGQVASAEARSYKPTWDRHECKTYVEIDDLQDITSFALVDSDAVAITDYELQPLNAIKKGSLYTRLVLDTYYADNLVATGKWGWTAVPASIPSGAYIQASRLAARRNSPFGVAGSPTDGSEIRLLAQLDPDFKTTLKPYVRKWYAR
jgi:hypothetical protein